MFQIFQWEGLLRNVVLLAFFEFMYKNCERHFLNDLKIVMSEEGIHVVYSRLANVVFLLESLI